MTATAAVARGQAAAEALMVDTCTVTRSGGESTFDGTTGNYTAATPSTVYTGKCRVKPSVLSGDRTVQAGEQAVALWPFAVHLPITATDIELNDIVTITASADPSLVGRTLRVRSVTRGTFVTARRVDCEDTSE